MSASTSTATQNATFKADATVISPIGFRWRAAAILLAIAPIAFGLLLDANLPKFVFFGVGAAFTLAIVAALAVGRDAREFRSAPAR